MLPQTADSCDRYYKVIPYTSDEQADAATKNPNLKLLFRLSKFYILDEGG